MYAPPLPTTWETFGEWMESQAGHLFNERVGLHKVMRDGGARFESVPEIEASLRHADFVFADPIQHYIRELVANPHDWPDVKPYPRGTLSLMEYRLNLIADWMREHQVKGRKPLQFPGCSFAELMEWLCGPWWDQYGRCLAAESLIIDHLFHREVLREIFGMEQKGKRRRRTRKRAAIDVAKRSARPQAEPDSWETLAERLEAEVPVFHAVPPFYKILCEVGETFGDMEAVNARTRHADEHYEEHLRPILENFAERGQWPKEPIDPVMGALIATRVKTAADWVRSHVVHGGCVIPYPAIPFRRFLRWLLLNWWDRPGRYAAANKFLVMHVGKPVRKGRSARLDLE